MTIQLIEVLELVYLACEHQNMPFNTLPWKNMQ